MVFSTLHFVARPHLQQTVKHLPMQVLFRCFSGRPAQAKRTMMDAYNSFVSLGYDGPKGAPGRFGEGSVPAIKPH
jgi:hypothetical protein